MGVQTKAFLRIPEGSLTTNKSMKNIEIFIYKLMVQRKNSYNNP